MTGAAENESVPGSFHGTGYRRSPRPVAGFEDDLLKLFDEPNWETGKNIWWNFRRADGNPWGLAGLWNVWTDKATGEQVESYTMLTLNADAHPLMSRMHKPDPKLAADKQDKRSVIPIEFADVDLWLTGTMEEAKSLLRLSPVEVFVAGPMIPPTSLIEEPGQGASTP